MTIIYVIQSDAPASLPETHESAFKLTFTSAVNLASVAFINMKSNHQPTAVANAILSNTFSLGNGSPCIYNRIRGAYEFSICPGGPQERSATAGVLHNLQNYTQWLLGPTLSGQLLWTFHSSSLFPDISGLSGISLASWLLQQFWGCTQQAYRPCPCPPSRPKKEPRVSNRPQWFHGWGILHLEARPWSWDRREKSKTQTLGNWRKAQL